MPHQVVVALEPWHAIGLLAPDEARVEASSMQVIGRVKPSSLARSPFPTAQCWFFSFEGPRGPLDRSSGSHMTLVQH
jgi:hypothetical protein